MKKTCQTCLVTPRIQRIVDWVELGERACLGYAVDALDSLWQEARINVRRKVLDMVDGQICCSQEGEIVLFIFGRDCQIPLLRNLP